MKYGALTLALVLSLSMGTHAAPQNMSFVTVKSVPNGLSVVLEDGKKVRLIGVDAFPASGDAKQDEALRAEAAEFLRKMVAGKRVWLEYESTRQDRAGNLLAYVFVMEDGAHVNAEMIRSGYGVAFTKVSYQHLAAFKKHQKAAEKAKTGLWAKYQPVVKAPAAAAAEPGPTPTVAEGPVEPPGSDDLSLSSAEAKPGAVPSVGPAGSGSPSGSAASSPRTRYVIPTNQQRKVIHRESCRLYKAAPGAFQSIAASDLQRLEDAGYLRCAHCR